MTDSKIHTVLSELMGDMSEAALARAVDLPKATINRVLSGRTPDPRAGTLVPIAQYFKISVDQLLGIAPLNPNTPLERINSEMVEVPLIQTNELIDLKRNLQTRNTIIKVSSLNSSDLDENCFVTYLNSDELFPLFSNGSLLIISTNVHNIRNNDPIIAIDNKSVLFRKYVHINNTKFLSSPNPKYDIVPFNQETTIIGKIIEGRFSV